MRLCERTDGSVVVETPYPVFAVAFFLLISAVSAALVPDHYPAPEE